MIKVQNVGPPKKNQGNVGNALGRLRYLAPFVSREFFSSRLEKAHLPLFSFVHREGPA